MEKTQQKQSRNWLTRFRFKLLGSVPPDETGEEQAQRFVATVTRLAKDSRIIAAYPHPGWRSSPKENYGWVWMLNAKWRARVLELLKDAPVRDAAFHEPDNLDGWSFHAISTAPVPRVVLLDLDQSL